jgi:hypothetical protein
MAEIVGLVAAIVNTILVTVQAYIKNVEDTTQRVRRKLELRRYTK